MIITGLDDGDDAILSVGIVNDIFSSVMGTGSLNASQEYYTSVPKEDSIVSSTTDTYYFKGSEWDGDGEFMVSFADTNTQTDLNNTPTETEQHLSDLGVTKEVAKNFIMDNLNNLKTIYDTCIHFSVTNDMIAEIVEINGIDGIAVANHFAHNGFESNNLGGSQRSIDVLASQIEEPNIEIPIDIVNDGVYSGTFNGVFYGDFSFNINDDVVTGSWNNPVWNETANLNGTVNNETGELTASSYDADGSVTFIGILSTNDVNGTWTSALGEGTFEGNFIG